MRARSVLPTLGLSAGQACWLTNRRNSFRNTLEGYTGGFFDRMLAAAGTGPVGLFHTADHGQDLHQTLMPPMREEPRS